MVAENFVTCRVYTDGCDRRPELIIAECHDPRWTNRSVAIRRQRFQYSNETPAQSVPATAILALVNQTFQSRIYIFTENKVLVGILFIDCLCNGCSGVGSVFAAPKSRPVVEGNLSLQCALDTIIAGDIYMHFVCNLVQVTLSVNFTKLKTSFATTDAVLNGLICIVVQSGAFTAQLHDLRLSGELPVSVSNNWTTPAGADGGAAPNPPSVEGVNVKIRDNAKSIKIGKNRPQFGSLLSFIDTWFKS
ncbi:hypothetical protein GGX14DRAFT_402283 [Mycena pura]|uniref:Uncharacterized protein n=1 Tax=Mycena pura TaxID=153505 RepID=A0AAD6UZ99_9AGAR|nr:hypothetical protein GGX14DRAFT_402283 [Mycena pura]